MQLGESRVAEREQQHCQCWRLCYYCGCSGHQIHRCPEKPSTSQVGENSLMFSLTVPVSVHYGNQSVPVSALIDSGAAVNLIDQALVEELHSSTFPCTPPLRITAINSQPIGGGYLTHQTALLELRVGLFHWETLAFYVILSPANPLILGFPWLRQHNPHISWAKGELLQWSPHCTGWCLHGAVPRPCLTMAVKSTRETAIARNPWQYVEFHGVFSKERASHLPVHRSWDCAINLLSNTTSPPRTMFTLSPCRNLPPWSVT
ncbi:hypothetical protein QTP70_011613 [Hemibagrus guttatus]|uniref:CCHC-type domain-containing protein n=1 Tax=Hemibagrus guttatus TaxID=175788 RepID=A0AAE0R6X9_9TELE|nr:hypothetical protein QTP70_011613 [Hemibagrus guttatus]KAK3567008.1 hypothetical protein QTP86_008948 [Hemibagrus guttatus]